jgi:hypothetical protein
VLTSSMSTGSTAAAPVAVAAERRQSLIEQAGERVGGHRIPSAIRRERSEQLNIGSRTGVLRRRERRRFLSASDDEVAGFRARSAASGASN